MFNILKEDRNNIMVEAQGRIDTEDYVNFVPTLESLVTKFNKINCVADLSNLDSISSGAMLEEVKLSHKYRDNVGRYAIVGASPSLDEIISIASSLNNGEVKTFARGEDEKAWQWIQEA